MKKVEPELSDALHADVTPMIRELTSLNVMKTMHGIGSVPKPRFRGRGWRPSTIPAIARGGG